MTIFLCQPLSRSSLSLILSPCTTQHLVPFLSPSFGLSSFHLFSLSVLLSLVLCLILFCFPPVCVLFLTLFASSFLSLPLSSLVVLLVQAPDAHFLLHSHQRPLICSRQFSPQLQWRPRSCMGIILRRLGEV